MANLPQLTQAKGQFKTKDGLVVRIRPLTMKSLGAILQSYVASLKEQAKEIIEFSGLSGQEKVQLWRDVIKEASSANLIDNPDIFTSPAGLEAMISESVELPAEMSFDDFKNRLELSEIAELGSEIASLSGLVDTGNSNIPFQGTKKSKTP